MPLPPPTVPWLGNVAPVRIRKLYFSEKLLDPNDPNSATTFYLTVEGQTPTPFDPSSGVPDIIVKQGDVEDWIIENRSTELHAFHIHQLHFMLVAWNGVPDERTVFARHDQRALYKERIWNTPASACAWIFATPTPSALSCTIAILLEHEDGGMMGLIRVEPADSAPAPEKKVLQVLERVSTPAHSTKRQLNHVPRGPLAGSANPAYWSCEISRMLRFNELVFMSILQSCLLPFTQEELCRNK